MQWVITFVRVVSPTFTVLCFWRMCIAHVWGRLIFTGKYLRLNMPASSRLILRRNY